MLMSWQSSVHVILMQYYSSYFNVHTHTHRWKDSLFENAFVCVMVFLFEILKTSVLFKAFSVLILQFFFLCMKFLKTFLWYLKLTEYVRSYRIFKSFNYSRVKLTSIFCITECSKFQITYQCTQKKWHAHKAFTNAMDNILVMAINRRKKKTPNNWRKSLKLASS